MSTLSLSMIAKLDKNELQNLKEIDFQRAVIEHAKAQGWECMSFRKTASPGKDGKWRGLANAGWPDIIAIRGKRMLALELKSEKGKATPAQRRWLTLLHHAGAEEWIVTPSSAAELIGILRG